MGLGHFTVGSIVDGWMAMVDGGWLVDQALRGPANLQAGFVLLRC
jgi:hypothetical protein